MCVHLESDLTSMFNHKANCETLKMRSRFQLNLGREQQEKPKNPSTSPLFRNSLVAAFFLLLTPVFSAPAYASSNEVEKASIDPCADASSGTYSSMVNCQQHLMDGEEKRLRETFAKLVREIESSQYRKAWKKKLLESQKAWLNYRDTHCTLQNMVVRDVGQQMPPMPSCLGGITSERTKELETLYKCIAIGGGECPWP